MLALRSFSAWFACVAWFACCFALRALLGLLASLWYSALGSLARETRPPNFFVLLCFALLGLRALLGLLVALLCLLCACCFVCLLRFGKLYLAHEARATRPLIFMRSPYRPPPSIKIEGTELEFA